MRLTANETLAWTLGFIMSRSDNRFLDAARAVADVPGSLLKWPQWDAASDPHQVVHRAEQLVVSKAVYEAVERATVAQRVEMEAKESER